MNEGTAKPNGALELNVIRSKPPVDNGVDMYVDAFDDGSPTQSWGVDEQGRLYDPQGHIVPRHVPRWYLRLVRFLFRWSHRIT